MADPSICGRLWLNIRNEFASPIPLAPNNDETLLTVGDLLLDGGRLWDEEKIDSLFPSEVGNAIKSTPISWSGGEDIFTWVHSRSGNFSVKSGYHLAFQSTQEKDRGQDSSSSEFNSILWKKIWNLKALGFHGEFLAATCSQISVPVRNHGDILVRDENGSVVEINHGRIRVSSALAAEAWAIRIAVSMALAWGKKDAVIESDCQPLVNMLQPKSGLKNWTIQAFLDDIISFSANSNFVFSWCNRQANRCANWIACNSRLGVGIPLAPCCLPIELCSLIRLDL
ncbi:hypothetical protein RHGRI_036147 [Rhododendron griersonianum]|uniref:RNase H type-1 domain-containing protein n=2 Tax=Rhododendron griersonianum TaxID=479676 RepID=A0AAV6HLY1_9ERIC|nr:hypothetical protein RHGRI_036147 [Rhododendron griersonianum]